MPLAALVALVSFFCIPVPQGRAEVPANGRVWEQVTFRAASSTRNLGLKPMGDSGDRIVYATVGPPPGGLSGALLGYGTALRGPSGWELTPLGFPYTTESTQPVDLFEPVLPHAFSADGLSSSWITSVPMTPDGQPEGKLGLYRSFMGGPLQFIAQVGEGTTFESYGGFADIASDGGRVVFVTSEHLLPGDAGRTEGKSIYAWDAGGLQLVDVDNGGALLSTCGTTLSRSNGMSLDANRVFFTVPAACGGHQNVYVRELNSHETIQISASKCTRVDCNAAQDVTYAGATRDGRIAYLTTAQQLTNADEDNTTDLYGYNVDTRTLTLLSGGSPAAGGEVLNTLVNPSEDGSRVYFRGSGEVLPGEPGGGEKLFVADSTGPHFIANATVAPQSLELSADGSQALFVTPSQALPADTDSVDDAYLYDANAQTLTRISTGPTGGNGSFPVSIDAPEFVNRAEFEFGNFHPYYAIDGSGNHVFFATKESLLADDTNGEFDDYEVSHGTIGLVTPGNQPLESGFGGVSRDGRSFAFATNATLVPEDRDGEGRDIYVARLEGGFPQPPPSPVCSSSSCPLPPGTRVTRTDPISLASPPAAKAGRLRLLDVASKAKKGAIGVLVSIPAPGLVSGQLWIREGGKKVILASGKTGAARSGKVQLDLQLEPAARRAPAVIKKGHLTVSAGSSKASKVVEVKVR